MPTLETVKSALRQFLDEPVPSIIALNGSWGRGKSFFWREFLRNHVVENDDDRLYSYISLFGLGDLQSLKDAVFDQAVPLSSIGLTTETPEPSPMERARGLARRARGLPWDLKKLTNLLDKVPRLGEVAPFARAVAFLSVKNYVVCIDDLERRGTSLPIRDVLGLATLLREQKDCRVLVILNSDALNETSGEREEYDRLREKVFDYELVFEPSASECATIAFPESDAWYRQARDDAARLNITNLRVLFRVRRLLDRLLAEAQDASDSVKRQLVHSAVLLGWCYNTRDGTAPSYEYVKGFNYGRLVDRILGKEPTENERSWSALLQSYDYSNTDVLDLAICATLERGFADTHTLRRLLVDKEEALRRNRLEEEFRAAWQIFHGGFGDDVDRLSDAFEASFNAAPELINVMNASAAVQLLRTMGKETLADDLMRRWLEANKRLNPEALNLERNPWRGDVHNRFRAVVEAAYVEVAPPPPTLRTVVERLASSNGWSEGDVAVLAEASADEFYTLFKSLAGDEARVTVLTCARFSDIGGDARYRQIGTSVREALGRIAKESPLNADRVRSMGVHLPDELTQDR